MRFPSFAFAAVAGLWQQPLAPEEETVTSTRHIHITRTVTNAASTIYAVRMGTSTVYMEHLPATLITKSVPWQALQTGHLELRSEGELTSTMHIKVTQTVAQVQATVFASKVGTSVSTITNVPQSLVDEAAEDAAELSSSQLAAAISSAKSEALAHSTVAALASTTSSTVELSSASASTTQPEAAPSPNYMNSSHSPTSVEVSVAKPSPSSIITGTSTILPIGLELRSNAGVATNTQLTSTEAPATVVAVIYGSSTSIMTSVPSTLLAAIVSSQATSISQTSISRTTVDADVSTQATEAIAPVDTNAAQVKSTQTALIQALTYSDEAAATSSDIGASSTRATGLFPSSSKTSSTTSTSSSAFVTSNKVYTIHITTSQTSSSSSHITSVSSVVETTAAASFPSAYGSQSSASAAADVAADNAAGASGGDSGSFKLSKGGFAAIISVVSIGVGLGIIFLVLFVVAKRRQWNVRKSIARASRRLTGRFSSHPNKTALKSEKEPTLPIIEPRQPLGPRPAPSSRRAQQGFANIDATLHTNYRGVETVGRSASRGPEVWRREMAKERQQQQQQRSQSQRRKPELRVDTDVAARGLEEGRVQEQKKRSRGDWRDLFRAL
ncbi:hypothetical protein D6C86_09263 [Aureobasidium pullulans]|uniref:Uncharacterized protein n=1 Tax=Aureobasidium pullulans TaxID=5580 RepID=A0A4S9U9T3_AURPU|nr:hypothetical protein D6C94_07418 [Aureobasidium pullulans]THZ34874.1 hypothetical protein D6C87_10171 [Aureobasidium pullulans]THZ54658.1 hypothetical protein D6C86_09263 [Aureobasidium pullulans]